MKKKKYAKLHWCPKNCGKKVYYTKAIKKYICSTCKKQFLTKTLKTKGCYVKGRRTNITSRTQEYNHIRILSLMKMYYDEKTASEVSRKLNIHWNTARVNLEKLLKKKLVTKRKEKHRVFYQAIRK